MMFMFAKYGKELMAELFSSDMLLVGATSILVIWNILNFTFFYRGTSLRRGVLPVHTAEHCTK